MSMLNLARSLSHRIPINTLTFNSIKRTNSVNKRFYASNTDDIEKFNTFVNKTFDYFDEN